MTDALPIGRSNQLVQVVEGEEGTHGLSAAEVQLRISRLAEQENTDPSQPGGAICERCCDFFDYRPRSQAEQEQLHQALFMTGPAVGHIHRVCNSCFECIVYPALRNERVEMVGIANHRQPNLALAHLR